MAKFTAVAYYGGIPPNNNNLEKPLILDNFLTGVTAATDTGLAHRAMTVIPCDVALIQGFVHEHGKTLPHLTLRKNVIDYQRQRKARSLIVDSNLFLYADPSNAQHYLRYSFDGVFPNTGFYFDLDVNPQRWQSISKNLGINLKPYRSVGNHILICLQRHGGWSMRGLHTAEWLDQTILQLRQYSQRPIVVRAHPGDKKIQKMLKITDKNTVLSTRPNLQADLQNAWATVVYNSSPSVASTIEGVPTFLTDPHPEHSQSYPVANLDICKIESPELKERQTWIEKLSMCHWNFQELKSGEAWNHFRKYI